MPKGEQIVSPKKLNIQRPIQGASTLSKQKGSPLAKTKTTGTSVQELSKAQKNTLTRLNNIVRDHLTKRDFSGTLRDLQGNPVPKPGGGYWDHRKEMTDSYLGLTRIRRGLQGFLNSRNLSDANRIVLQSGFDKANAYINRIEALFSPYGGVK
ncbi:polymorphic toxin type 28 domain-containing protein [Clostridium saccharoperbutylacetonicum]